MEDPTVPDHKKRPRSARVAGVVFAVAIALTGCAGITSPGSLYGEAAEIVAAPATGPIVSGNGYTFAAPVGWSVPANLTLQNVDILVSNPADQDSFGDNVCIILTPGRIIPTLFEWQAIEDLKESGATDIIKRGRVIVAGSEAVHVSSIVTSRGVESQAEQYFFSAEGQTYTVTFSFSLTVPKSQRDAVAQSVLASWTWT